MEQATEGKVGVSNVSTAVLASLELHGTMRPSEIVELTGLTSGGVTKVISRFERSGLVTRRHGEFSNDKRGIAVSLTDKGHEAAQRLGDAFAGELDCAREIVEDVHRLLQQ